MRQRRQENLASVEQMRWHLQRLRLIDAARLVPFQRNRCTLREPVGGVFSGALGLRANN